MAETKPFDLGAMFNEAVTTWEREFDENANRIMGSQAYSMWMNAAQANQLTLQKAFSDYMNHQLKIMEVPSREDMVRLSEAVLGLDKRMARIERMLKKLSEPAKPAARKSQARSRRPAADKLPAVSAQAEAAAVTSTSEDKDNG